MKRSALLLFMCFVVSTAFCQTKQTGFTQLSVYTQMMEDADYWDTMYQYFMKEHQYRYVCITCPSFEPESCLVIGADSTLTLITLDKQVYSYLRSGKKDEKRPTASRKSLTVSANFVKDLQNLIDLGSLTSNAYTSSRMLDGTTNYFLSYRRGYHSSKTHADGKSANGGNEACQLMVLINEIRDAVAGNKAFDEADLTARIRKLHKHIYTLLPADYEDRVLYDMY